MKRYLFAILAIFWMAGIFWLSSRPVKDVTPPFPHFDKLVHMGLFGILGVFWFFHFHLKTKTHPKESAILALFISAIYGIVDEVHQAFVPHRSPDILDWIADFIGLSLMLLLLLWLLGIKEKRPK